MMKIAPKLLILSSLFAGFLRSQTAVKQNGVIRLPSIQILQISPPGLTAGRYWAITDLPRADDIEVADERVKLALVQLFDRLRAEKHPWHFRKGAWNLLGELKREPLTMYEISLVRASVYTQRPVEGTMGPGEIEISFIPQAPAPVREMRVEIWSTGYLQETIDAENRRNGLPASTEKPTVEFGLGPVDSVSLATARTLRAEVESVGETTLRDAFRRAALATIGIARRNGLRAGAPMEETVRARTADDITRYFGVRSTGSSGPSWPAPQAKIETAGGGIWFIKLKGAAIATDARIQTLAGSKFAVTERGKTARLHAELLRVQTRMNRKYAASLAAFRNSVPTRDQVEALAARLDDDPEVQGRASPASGGASGNELIFQATNHWVIYGFSLKGGISYSPEQSATGDASLAADNLLRTTNEKRGLSDLENIDVKGGYDRRFARGSLDVVKEFRSCRIGAGVRADYLFDRNQAMGNPPDERLDYRDSSAGPQVSFDCRTPEITGDFAPRRNLFAFQTTTGFEWRDAEVRAAEGMIQPLGSGTIHSFYATMGVGWSFENPVIERPGVGLLAAGIRATERKGLASADFPFNQVLVSAELSSLFGFDNSTDILARFRQGAGSSTGVVPLFQLFRLGGPENVRGIESGEFVGRQIAFQQMEAGLSIRWVVSWFRRSPSSGERPRAIDLSKVYVKGFYDRGKLLNDASAGDLFSFAHAMKGYGFAVELRGLNVGSKRVNLSAGYARSPDSLRHTSGVAITGASIQF